MVNVIVQSGGTSGPRGNSMLSGTGAPTSTVGIDGDYYIDTTNAPTSLTLYGPRASGTWPATGTTLSSTAGYAALAGATFTGAVTVSDAAFNVSGYSTLAGGQANNDFTIFGALAAEGNVGFTGATPVGRQTVTGSRSDGTALASVLTALAAFGLITDNTTA